MNLVKIWYDILEGLLQKQIRPYSLSVGKEKFRFYPHEVIRAEADGSYTRIICQQNEYLVSKNLRQIEQIFHGWGFIRINRSNLINVTHISGIKDGRKYIIMSDGQLIKIPRRSKKLAEELNAIHKIQV